MSLKHNYSNSLSVKSIKQLFMYIAFAFEIRICIFNTGQEIISIPFRAKQKSRPEIFWWCIFRPFWLINFCKHRNSYLTSQTFAMCDTYNFNWPAMKFDLYTLLCKLWTFFCMFELKCCLGIIVHVFTRVKVLCVSKVKMKAHFFLRWDEWRIRGLRIILFGSQIKCKCPYT